MHLINSGIPVRSICRVCPRQQNKQLRDHPIYAPKPSTSWNGSIIPAPRQLIPLKKVGNVWYLNDILENKINLLTIKCFYSRCEVNNPIAALTTSTNSLPFAGLLLRSIRSVFFLQHQGHKLHYKIVTHLLSYVDP